MSKIITHLWFDTQAVAAAEFYCSVFKNAAIKNKTVLENTPLGKDMETVLLEIEGSEFSMISAGPYFKVNPSISFTVNCTLAQEVEELWAKLIEGGTSLMELGEYDFSQKYGWVMDKFGVSWQIIVREGFTQKIIPSLLFVGDACGRAEEAAKYYASILPNSSLDGEIARYSSEEGPNKAGDVKYMSFSLMNKQFIAMDSAHTHEFAFNEGVSLMVYCDTQEEIDAYWEKLSFVPEAEQCGWLKDKFGVSWQIVSSFMDEMMATKDENKLSKVTEAFLQMKKFDIAKLQKVFEEA